MSDIKNEDYVVNDANGNEVGIGDTVAGAFRLGNIAVLRIGEVVGFGERSNRLTVKVKWYVESADQGPQVVNINGAIEADLYRFVKIDS